MTEDRRDEYPAFHYEAEEMILDLLCEDGFLTAKESRSCVTQRRWRQLLRMAARRGFPRFLSRDVCPLSCIHAKIVKWFSRLCVWTNLRDEDTHLRAPPQCA